MEHTLENFGYASIRLKQDVVQSKMTIVTALDNPGER
jgi:hypothetical protein